MLTPPRCTFICYLIISPNFKIYYRILWIHEWWDFDEKLINWKLTCIFPTLFSSKDEAIPLLIILIFMLVTVQLLIITQRTILLHLISLTVPLPAMRSRVQVLFLPSESVPLSLLPPLTTMASSIATLIINTQLLNSTSASTLFLSLRALTVVLNAPYYLLSLLICILFD